jgi:hypothetical protein
VRAGLEPCDNSIEIIDRTGFVNPNWVIARAIYSICFLECVCGSFRYQSFLETR